MDRKEMQTIIARVNDDLRNQWNLNENVLRMLAGTTPAVISDEERQEIGALIGAKARRIDQLLDLIKLREVAVYSQFMEVLQKTDGELYTKVKAVENAVHPGTPPVQLDPPTPIPQPIVPPNQVVTDNDVLDILGIFNIAKLDDVFIRLGLKRNDIDNVQKGYNGLKENATLVLNLWRDKKAGAATRDNLFEGMAQVEECNASRVTLKRKWGYRVGVGNTGP